MIVKHAQVQNWRQTHSYLPFSTSTFAASFPSPDMNQSFHPLFLRSDQPSKKPVKATRALSGLHLMNFSIASTPRLVVQ